VVADEQLAAWDAAHRSFRDAPEAIEEAQVGKNYSRSNAPGGLVDIAQRIFLPAVQFGGRALDAGCGTGEWTIGLSRLFERVDAIDLNRLNTEFLSAVLAKLSPRPAVSIVNGALEALPFANDIFDFVFCRSVIFMTRAERSLAELFRVMRPGGQAHLSVNADGFNRYLVEVRGLTSADARRQGLDTLYNTAWRRHGDAVRKALARSRGRTVDGYEKMLTRLRPLEREAVQRLAEHALSICGLSHRPVIEKDLVEMAAGIRSDHTTSVRSEAWLPEEFRQIAAAAGFVNFRWAPYGWEPVADGVMPLDKGPLQEDFADYLNVNLHFHGGLSVWECRLEKPIESS
jgi:ubiquinone/menaquinone biosynthesis C-methylase UbiE